MTSEINSKDLEAENLHIPEVMSSYSDNANFSSAEYCVFSEIRRRIFNIIYENKART